MEYLHFSLSYLRSIVEFKTIIDNCFMFPYQFVSYDLEKTLTIKAKSN